MFIVKAAELCFGWALQFLQDSLEDVVSRRAADEIRCWAQREHNLL